MKKILVLLSVILMSNIAYSGTSCLTEVGTGDELSSCSEVSSSNPQVEESYRMACVNHPNGKVVNTCPGNLGCAVNQDTGGIDITITLWHSNEVPEDSIVQTCEAIGGTVVSK